MFIVSGWSRGLSTLAAALPSFPVGKRAGKAPTAALAPAVGQVQPALERFARTLPFWVRATDDFRRGAYRERREVARSLAEIAPDSPEWLTTLRFDIDSDGGGAAWIEAELPAPNLVVVNPRNGHAHLIYLLGAWVPAHRKSLGSAR